MSQRCWRMIGFVLDAPCTSQKVDVCWRLPHHGIGRKKSAILLYHPFSFGFHSCGQGDNIQDYSDADSRFFISIVTPNQTAVGLYRGVAHLGLPTVAGS